MTYGLSYQAAATDDRLLRQAWLVFVDRDGTRSFSDPGRTVPLRELRFLQSFYVHSIDLDAGSLRLVHAKIGRRGRLDNAVITEDWGWVKMDDLLLSARAYRDPNSFIPQRALVKTQMTGKGITEVPKLYTAPSKQATAVQELEYTSFFYVYKVWPAQTLNYDPQGSYDWYFVASEPFFSGLSADLPISAGGRRGFAGWLPGGNTLIWNTREALEPALDRRRSASIFSTPQDALDYIYDPKSLDDASVIDQTPRTQTWIDQRFRYPVLGSSESSGKAQAQLIAYQGKAQLGSRSDELDFLAYEAALGQIHELAGQPKVMFVFDGAALDCRYFSSLVRATAGALRGVQATSLTVEYGAVIYRETRREVLTLPPTGALIELQSQLNELECNPLTTAGGDLLHGLQTAFDLAEGRTGAYITYILLGSGASRDDGHRIEEVATLLSGLNSGGFGASHLFSFHVLRLDRNPNAKRKVKARFEQQAGSLFDAFTRREAPFLEPGRKRSHSYKTLDFEDPSSWRRIADKAAGLIKALVRTAESVQLGTELALTTGAPLTFDDPVATEKLESFLLQELGEDGLRIAREQRAQLFYQGWVPTHDAEGQRIMTSVLFLSSRETSELLDMVERMRESHDCKSWTEYIVELIGTVPPEDEPLPISLLIERRKGIRFQSELLQAPFYEIQTLCNISRKADFNELLQRLEEFDQYLDAMISIGSGAEAESRKYRLLSGDFYWVPMDKLP